MCLKIWCDEKRAKKLGIWRWSKQGRGLHRHRRQDRKKPVQSSSLVSPVVPTFRVSQSHASSRGWGLGDWLLQLVTSFLGSLTSPGPSLSALVAGLLLLLKPAAVYTVLALCTCWCVPARRPVYHAPLAWLRSRTFFFWPAVAWFLDG